VEKLTIDGIDGARAADADTCQSRQRNVAFLKRPLNGGNHAVHAALGTFAATRFSPPATQWFQRVVIEHNQHLGSAKIKADPNFFVVVAQLVSFMYRSWLNQPP
jgi:hypothetical protein